MPGETTRGPAVGPTLIIGAAGFLGRHIARRLTAEGIPVVGLGSRRPGDIPFSRFHIGRTELAGLLDEALEGCVNVVFAGGTTRPGAPMRTIGAELASEAGHVIDVAELCAARGVARFVFLSSGGAIYGRTDATRIEETHPTEPISSYGLAKLVAEHGLRLVGLRSGMRVISLRIANPYGPGQMVRGSQGFVAAVVRAARGQQTLEIWGDGSVVRDFVYVDDVAESVILALMADVPSTVINIGSSVGVSLVELLATFERLSGSRMTPVFLPERGVDVPRVVLDIGRARALLGWQPAHSLERGLALTIAAENLGHPRETADPGSG
jgi:UDP-glucose 4-epimerase